MCFRLRRRTLGREPVGATAPPPPTDAARGVRSIALVTIVACVAALGVPSSASAATAVVGSDRGEVASPRLTTSGALWLSTVASDYDAFSTRMLRGRPGGRVDRFAAVGGRTVDDAGYGGVTEVSRLTVSGEHVAVSATSQDTAKSKYTGSGIVATTAYLLNLTTRARTKVLECGEFGGGESALAYPRLAYVGCLSSLSGGNGPVVVRDLGRPGASAVQLAEAGSDVRAAGTMVGWRSADAFVVRDLMLGAEILRLPLSALGGSVRAWDMQADGKLAVAVATAFTDGSDSTKIVWAVPGDTNPKLAVIVGGTFRGLRLVGDRLAFERGAARLELVVQPLQGSEHVVARYGAAKTGGFDFNGSRVAWARARCDTTEVAVRAADEPGSDDHGFGVCPLTIESDGTVDRRGRLSARANCPTLSPSRTSDFCSVVATLRLNGKPIGSARRRFRAGTSATLRFTAQPLLLRRRPATLVIRATNRMRGGTLVRRATITPTYADRPRR